jgi:hypothetical protein
VCSWRMVLGSSGAYQERSPLGVPCSAPREHYSKS